MLNNEITTRKYKWMDNADRIIIVIDWCRELAADECILVRVYGSFHVGPTN